MIVKKKSSKKHKLKKMLLELLEISRTNTRKRMLPEPERTEHLPPNQLLTRLLNK